MQTILVTLLACCISCSTYAQLGWTQKEVKEEYGTADESSYTDDGENWYLRYDTEVYSEESGYYKQVKVCYFLKNSYEATCVYWCLFVPRAEVNTSIKLFNEKFVNIGDMKWKDYSREVIYKVELDEELCIVKCYYDLD